jgi:hypothetical protein
MGLENALKLLYVFDIIFEKTFSIICYLITLVNTIIFVVGSMQYSTEHCINLHDNTCPYASVNKPANKEKLCYSGNNY